MIGTVPPSPIAFDDFVFTNQCRCLVVFMGFQNLPELSVAPFMCTSHLCRIWYILPVCLFTASVPLTFGSSRLFLEIASRCSVRMAAADGTFGILLNRSLSFLAL